MYWQYSKRTAPRADEGASSKKYGTTWWGQQWLQALTNIDDANRLPAMSFTTTLGGIQPSKPKLPTEHIVLANNATYKCIA
jgi:hypothetical protein